MLLRGSSCIPLVAEVFGGWCNAAINVFSTLSQKIATQLCQPLNEVVATIYSFTLMRQNARAILARCVPSSAPQWPDHLPHSGQIICPTVARSSAPQWPDHLPHSGQIICPTMARSQWPDHLPHSGSYVSLCATSLVLTMHTGDNCLKN